MAGEPTLWNYIKEAPEVLKAYALIGAIASQWSHIEMAVDVTIWRLGCIDHHRGACITSQIQSLDYKLEALASLVHHKLGDGDLFTSVNKFSGKAAKIRRERNEAVHRAISQDDGKASGIVITADRRLVYNLSAEKLDALTKVESKLASLLGEYQILDEAIAAGERAWADKILAMLSTSP